MVRKIVFYALRLLGGIIKKEPSEEIVESCAQFVKFGIVGVSNTVISYVVYASCLLCFRKSGIQFEGDYLAAQMAAFALSVLWSFYWNNKAVFQLKEGERRPIWKSLLKTYVSYSFTGLFLNSLLLIAWVRMLGISEFIAPIINLAVSVPINFLMNKYWAFRA